MLARWKDVTIGAVGSLVATALLSLGPLLYGNLLTITGTIPMAWIIILLTIVLLISALNSILPIITPTRRFFSALIGLTPGSLGTLTFLSVALSGEPSPQATQFAAILGLLVVVLAESALLATLLRRIAVGLVAESAVGFAATGVLIDEYDPRGPHFVLVFNKNLRDGAGLWVPPGGHFHPIHEDPADRLIERIRSEVGLQASLLPTNSLIPPSNIRHTDGATWIDSPAFLLKESLFGTCSHGHTNHIDYVYICVTDGRQQVDYSPKYTLAQQLRVNLDICAQGHQETQQLLDQLAEEWIKAMSGKPSSLRTHVTSDVVWRLHLSAIAYTQRNFTPAT